MDYQEKSPRPGDEGGELGDAGSHLNTPDGDGQENSTDFLENTEGAERPDLMPAIELIRRRYSEGATRSIILPELIEMGKKQIPAIDERDARAILWAFLQREKMPNPKKPTLFDVMTIEDIKNQPPVDWLVGGLIPAESHCMTYGQPGSGKSFFMGDIALSIGVGAPTGIGRSTKRGQVVYILNEGKAGFRKRIRAWEAWRKMPAQGVEFLTGGVQMLSPEYIEELKAFLYWLPDPPAMLIVDTKANSTAGMEENSSTGQTEYNQTANSLIEEFGLAFVDIHHPTKSDGKNDRGHGSQWAALDMKIHLEYASGMNDGHLIAVSCTKAKDEDAFEPFSFRLVRMDIGNEETSCAVADEGEAGRKLMEDPDVVKIEEVLTTWTGVDGIPRGELEEQTGLPHSRFGEKLKLAMKLDKVISEKKGKQVLYRLNGNHG